MKYYLFILCLVYPFRNLYSQKHKCPLDNGYIMVGYKNNEDEQRYSLFSKGKNSFPPIDILLLILKIKQIKCYPYLKGK